MAEYYSVQEYIQNPEVSVVEILSDSDEDNAIYPFYDIEKDESPDPVKTHKPSILTPPMSLKKRKNSYSSGKRKVKRIPCVVCNGRFGTQATLDLHMKLHWNVYNKMEELLQRITNKIKDKDLTTGVCKCSRCVYESRDNEKPYEITKNFICHVCDSSFLTGNKLSKHMDKHRECYFKMKKLEEENPFLFFDRPLLVESRQIVNTITHCEGSISTYIQNGDKHNL